MKKPTAQEIKRKIDSKIFELQSCLLSEDAGAVDEALLRECAAWFRPQHLQDIVVERSEAEGRCGWPGCGKKLPSWRLAAPLVFDLPEGEQLGRFCERACMAKTNIYLAAIPPTPPYSREHLVRLVCPPPTAGSDDGSKGGGAAGAGVKESGTKKVYKRARRRDIPPSNKSAAEGVSPTGAAAPKDGSGKGMSADQLPGGGVVEEKQGAEVADAVVPATNGNEKGEVGKTEEKEAEARQKRDAEASPVTAVAAADGGGVGGDGGNEGGAAGGGAGKSTDSEVGGGEDQGDADGTAVVRAALEKVSISEEIDRGSSVVGAAPEPAAPTSTATAAAVAPLVPAPAPAAPSTDWENLRLSRTSGGGASASRPSVVSLHASLAAAAAETAPAAANASASAATPAASVQAAQTGSPGSGIAPDPEKTGNGDNTVTADADTADTPGIDQESSPAAPGVTRSSPARRRSVSFADGTKEDPEPNASIPPPKPSARGSAAARKQAAAAAAAAGTGRVTGARGRGGRRGRGSGRASSGRGRGKAAPAPAPRKNVLGGVVERAPSVPTPMEPKAGGRENAGMVEGHLPKIEADLSFRVMPRGGYPGLGGGGAAAAGGENSLGAYGLGVDGGPLTGDEIEEEAEEELEEDGGEGVGEKGSENDKEAEENDRAIWRETFGEEMPTDVAEDSWIDMSAVRDKEMREEFASSIAPSALLWSALSEWVTPETRAVCRAGRSAAAKVQATAAAAAAAATPAVTAEKGGVGNAGSSKNGSGPLPADFQARKTGAVAEAIETEARRHSRHGRGRAKNGKAGKDKQAGGNGSRGEGPTLTGALRHSGVSAMVNMHLSQAERALRTASVTTTGGGSGSGGRPRRGLEGGENNKAGSSTKWVWSDTAAKARQGARVPGGWVEEGEAASASAAMAASAVPLAANTATKQGTTNSNKGNVPATAAPAPAPAPAPATKHATTKGTTRGTTEEAAERRRAEKENDGLTAAAAAAAATTEPVPVGGAGCRRAVAALIDTLDAGSASAAADLSIAQWKVVSLVLLTAAGLGAGAVGRGAGGTAGGGAGGGCCVSACGEAGVVGSEEAAGGAEACGRLCGQETSLSASEFRILVEVMLDD